jgi:uncharacterized protein
MTLILALATIGHGFIWVALVNRTHAVAMPQLLIKVLTVLMFLLAGGLPVAIAWALYRAATDGTVEYDATVLYWPATIYLDVCSVAGIWAVVQWSWRRFGAVWPQPERHSQSRVSRLAPPPGTAGIRSADACLLARLPGNEVLLLEEVERGVELARLPKALEGLSILHLSDLHLTGRIGKWYFAELVRRCNLRQPDLVAVTGDVVDNAACLDWIPDTLAKLTAPYGVYFVLGNHDRRVGCRRVAKTLDDAGMTDLGGRFLEVEIRGQRVVLAGNEVPWFRPAADFGSAPPSSLRGGPVRMVLAHSPDQLAWARRQEVDLLLAGHTHGGQVCLPLVGPIFAPCWHGVRHARGTYLAPPTVMHVSKGVSAELPLRIRCLPEAVMLVLHSPGSGPLHAHGGPVESTRTD